MYMKMALEMLEQGFCMRERLKVLMECVGAGWNVWELDRMCWSRTESVGEGWNVWQQSKQEVGAKRICSDHTVCVLKGNGICGSKMV